jgi:hypothetical protein
VAAGCLLYVSLVGCARHFEWTPFERQPTPRRMVDGQSIPLLQVPRAHVAELDRNCVACHTDARDPHGTLQMACIDCHGGDATATTKEDAHPKPRHPEHWKSAANPERSYALLNDESPEWIRFVNPGDQRVANLACGGCHGEHVLAVSKSTMTNSAPFWGMAAYEYGIAPFKRTIFGESSSPEGVADRTNNLVPGEDGLLRAPTEAELV